MEVNVESENILETKQVSVAFRIAGKFQKAIYDIDLSLKRGEVLAIVGESGSGKSTFATAVMGLHNPNQTQITGSILLDDEEVIGKTGDSMASIRGSKVGMIFQNPLTALNPLMKIGQQIKEMLAVHDVYPENQYESRSFQLLEQVGIPNPKRVVNQFPHQLSGGMRQRVMIAIAIANDPDLIIADEPTTALDVTIQAQILDLILEIQKKKNAGVILITHDLGVVAEVADTVAVMYAGQLVEKTSVEELFQNPKHPYTRSLLRSNPSAETVSDDLYVIPGSVPSLSKIEYDKDLFLARVPWMKEEAQKVISEKVSEILNLKDLKVYYPIRSGFFNRVTDNVLAVDGVDLTIHEGETVGLVGESGSGKSTIGKTIVGLEQMTSGQLIYKGQDVSKKKIRNQLKYNKDVQMIFQDAFSSLNPRKTIYDIIAEPIRNFEKLDANTENKRIHELLDIVGLPKQALEQYPFQFSGGQQQRIGIARAVATNPKLIVADEPVSALDLSVQAQVLNFMKLIQKDLGIAFLFISHDLGVVRHMTDNIAVMHNGRIVEKGTMDHRLPRLRGLLPGADRAAACTVDRAAHADGRRAGLPRLRRDLGDGRDRARDLPGPALREIGRA